MTINTKETILQLKQAIEAENDDEIIKYCEQLLALKEFRNNKTLKRTLFVALLRSDNNNSTQLQSIEKSDDPDFRYERAYMLYRHRKYDEVLQVLGTSHGNCDVLRAQSFFKLERFAEAAEQYEFAIAKDPDNFELLSNLLSCYIEGAMYEKAEKFAADHKDELSELYEYWFNLSVHYCGHNVTAAREALATALRLCDEDAQRNLINVMQHCLDRVKSNSLEKSQNFTSLLPPHDIMASCARKRFGNEEEIESTEKSSKKLNKKNIKKISDAKSHRVNETTMLCASAVLSDSFLQHRLAQTLAKKKKSRTHRVNMRYSVLLSQYSLCDRTRFSYSQRALALANFAFVLCKSTRAVEVFKVVLPELRELSERSRVAKDCKNFVLCAILGALAHLHSRPEISQSLTEILSEVRECRESESVSVRLAYAQVLISHRKEIAVLNKQTQLNVLNESADIVESVIDMLSKTESKPSMRKVVLGFKFSHLLSSVMLRTDKKSEMFPLLLKRFTKAIEFSCDQCKSFGCAAFTTLAFAVKSLKAPHALSHVPKILAVALENCKTDTEKSLVSSTIAILVPQNRTNFLRSSVKTLRAMRKVDMLSANTELTSAVKNSYSFGRALYVFRQMSLGQPCVLRDLATIRKEQKAKKTARALRRRRLRAQKFAQKVKVGVRVDPERWVKKKDRTTYRKKGKRKAALMRGAQGAQ